jgi:hypothetical protein
MLPRAAGFSWARAREKAVEDATVISAIARSDFSLGRSLWKLTSFRYGVEREGLKDGAIPSSAATRLHSFAI